MVAFEQILLFQIVIGAEKLGYLLGGVLGDLGGHFVAIEIGHAQYVEDQHAVVGDHGPPGLRDDGRVRHAGLVADALDAEDDVVGVLLQGVVDRRLEIGLRAVVINAEAAADVDVLDARSGPVQLGVDACDLGQGTLDAADVGDLAAEVEVDQLQAVAQVSLLEVFQRLQCLGQGQAELGPIAGTGAPAPRASRRQLDADADDRADLPHLGIANNQLQLRELLDDGDDLLADLAGQNRHLDELIVLETVADDGRVGAIGQGKDGEQFGLGACLQAEVEWLAVVQDLLDDLALLVDLDRVDAAVTTLVLVLLDGRLERLLHLADAVAEDVGEADEHGQLMAAGLELVDEILQIDGLI